MADFDPAFVTWPGSGEVLQTTEAAIPGRVAAGFVQCDEAGNEVSAKPAAGRAPKTPNPQE